MSIVSSISNSLARGLLFTQITRYINPELLSSILFASALLGYDIIGPENAEAIGQGIIIEFLMLHANVGIAVARFAANSEQSKRTFVMLASAFYFLFVIGLAFGMSAWWMALCFILVTWSRLHEPHDEKAKSAIFREGIIGMARFGVYMITGFVVAGILTIVEADDVFKMLAWGAVHFLALFLLRKKFDRLRNSKALADQIKKTRARVGEAVEK